MLSHTNYLELALQHAIKFDYLSPPNPSVGCILVNNIKGRDTIIGVGASQEAGKAHAEIMALQNAISSGFNTANASAYVTLEPCSHFGKTPPCVNALIKHKIKHVHIGITDPNPQVNGQGIKILQQNNIQVSFNQDSSLEKKITYSMRGFLHSKTHNKPWIRLKMAASLDGVMALDNGISKWLTSNQARMHNQNLRARAGAIISSINTVIADNPSLNVRINTQRQPLRIILDSKALGSDFLHYEIFKQQNIYPLLWICGNNACPQRISILQKHTKVKVINLALSIDKYSYSKNQHIDLHKLINYLYDELNINEIHVEGGAYLSTSFIQQDLCNEIALYQAPIWLGKGKRILEQQSLDNLDNLNQFKLFSSLQIGADNLLILLK